MAPSLHVFGDSFAGPFKLLDDTSARTKSFKGASAKVCQSVTTRKLTVGTEQPKVNQAGVK